jgi:murein DD-endopeptidase MepM/ murein hydrolase activator NlpD
MDHIVQRALAGALILAAATAAAAIGATPAAAQTRDPEDFEVEVFLHDTEEIAFDDDWSERRPGGRRHRGTDVKSPKGTPVLAVADGVVEELKWNGAGGWSISLRHADGWSTRYLHLNDDTPGTNDGRGGADTAYAPGIVEGLWVQAGRVIGSVGNSGNAEVPHTHFEIHRDDNKLNPFPYLEDALDRMLRPPRLGGVLP